jgi:antitoxin component YwqK of YwqJK toxin-antitoxin module
MKKLLVLIFAISGLVLGAQNVNDKGLYVDSDGALFSGVITQTHDNIKSSFHVREGVVNGIATYYYASGNMMEQGVFTNGQKDQKWTRYNENGTISAVAFYNLGKKTGTWLVYDDKGHKRFEMNYSNGEKTGVWTTWDENGAIAATKDYGKLN